MYDMPTYPANLCPLSRRVEFAYLRENFGESIGKAIEATFGGSVRQRSAEHFDCMLSEEQRIDKAI